MPRYSGRAGMIPDAGFVPPREERRTHDVEALQAEAVRVTAKAYAVAEDTFAPRIPSAYERGMPAPVQTRRVGGAEAADEREQAEEPLPAAVATADALFGIFGMKRVGGPVPASDVPAYPGDAAPRASEPVAPRRRVSRPRGPRGVEGVVARFVDGVERIVEREADRRIAEALHRATVGTGRRSRKGTKGGVR